VFNKINVNNPNIIPKPKLDKANVDKTRTNKELTSGAGPRYIKSTTKNTANPTMKIIGLIEILNDKFVLFRKPISEISITLKKIERIPTKTIISVISLPI